MESAVLTRGTLLASFVGQRVGFLLLDRICVLQIDNYHFRGARNPE